MIEAWATSFWVTRQNKNKRDDITSFISYQYNPLHVLTRELHLAVFRGTYFQESVPRGVAHLKPLENLLNSTDCSLLGILTPFPSTPQCPFFSICLVSNSTESKSLQFLTLPFLENPKQSTTWAGNKHSTSMVLRWVQTCSRILRMSTQV